MTASFIPSPEAVEAVAEQLEQSRRLHQIEAEVYPFDDERPPLTEWLTAHLVTSEPFQNIIREAQQAVTVQHEVVKDALRSMLAFSSKDWSKTAEDAYLYGLVLGWNGDETDPEDEGAWEKVAELHNWDEQKLTRLKALHEAFVTSF